MLGEQSRQVAQCLATWPSGGEGQVGPGSHGLAWASPALPSRGGGLCYAQWPRVAMASLDRAAVGPPGGEATCARVSSRPPPSTPAVYSSSGTTMRTTHDRKLRRIQTAPPKPHLQVHPAWRKDKSLSVCLLQADVWSAHTPPTPRAGPTPCPAHPPVTVYNGHFPRSPRAAPKLRTDVLGQTVLGAVLGPLPPPTRGSACLARPCGSERLEGNWGEGVLTDLGGHI